MSATLESAARATLGDVVVTGRLSERPARIRHHLDETRCMTALVEQMAHAPEGLLNTLVSVAMSLTGAPSAGVSLVDKTPEGREHFLWVAMGGRYCDYVGGETPLDHSPCGYTMRAGSPQLFHRPGRYFESLAGADPELYEGLVVPIVGSSNTPLGTLWVAQHDASGEFNLEDARLLNRLTHLAGIGLMVINDRDRAHTSASAARQAAGAAEQSNRQRAEFVATVAHELRNPLSPILTASAYARHINRQPELERPLQTIERQGRQLARIIDDLLDLSLMERQQLAIQPGNFMLSELISTAVETVQPIAQAKAQALEVRYGAMDVPMHGDMQRLSQVVTNLLNNAAKYTQSGGYIELAVRVTEEAAEIVVTDNGPGIEPEMLPRLFELFSQGSTQNVDSSRGLGVGLFVVKRIIDLHGGRVSAASAGHGKGACFTVTIPRRMNQA